VIYLLTWLISAMLLKKTYNKLVLLRLQILQLKRKLNKSLKELLFISKKVKLIRFFHPKIHLQKYQDVLLQSSKLLFLKVLVFKQIFIRQQIRTGTKLLKSLFNRKLFAWQLINSNKNSRVTFSQLQINR
jgi:hypothetical protein